MNSNKYYSPEAHSFNKMLWHQARFYEIIFTLGTFISFLLCSKLKLYVKCMLCIVILILLQLPLLNVHVHVKPIHILVVFSFQFGIAIKFGYDCIYHSSDVYMGTREFRWL